MSPISSPMSKEELYQQGAHANESLTWWSFALGRQHMLPFPLRALSKQEKKKKEKKEREIAFETENFLWLVLRIPEQTSFSFAFRDFLVWP